MKAMSNEELAHAAYEAAKAEFESTGKALPMLYVWPPKTVAVQVPVMIPAVAFAPNAEILRRMQQTPLSLGARTVLVAEATTLVVDSLELDINRLDDHPDAEHKLIVHILDGDDEEVWYANIFDKKMSSLRRLNTSVCVVGVVA